MTTETSRQHSSQHQQKPLSLAWISRLLVVLLLFACGSSAFGQAMTTIRGRVVFRDAEGGLSPVRNTQLLVWDDDWFATDHRDVVLGTLLTDSNGDFTFSYDPTLEGGWPDSGLRDPKIVLKAVEAAGRPGQVATGSKVTYTGDLVLVPYMWDLAPGVHDLGTLIVDQGIAGAFDHSMEKSLQTMSWMQDARDALAIWGFPLPDKFLFSLTPSGTTRMEAPPARDFNPLGSDYDPVRFRPRSIFNEADLTRDVIYRYIGMMELHHLFDTLYDGAVFPAYPDESVSLPVRQVDSALAFVHGFGCFIAALIKFDPLIIGTSSNPFLLNIELNHDGWGSSNGNEDGASDVAGRTGDLTVASVAALFWDLIDGTSLSSDPYDRSSIPLQDNVCQG